MAYFGNKHWLGKLEHQRVTDILKMVISWYNRQSCNGWLIVSRLCSIKYGSAITNNLGWRRRSVHLFKKIYPTALCSFRILRFCLFYDAERHLFTIIKFLVCTIIFLSLLYSQTNCAGRWYSPNPPCLKFVATLPCEIWMFCFVFVAAEERQSACFWQLRNAAIAAKSHGSTARPIH